MVEGNKGLGPASEAAVYALVAHPDQEGLEHVHLEKLMGELRSTGEESMLVLKVISP